MRRNRNRRSNKKERNFGRNNRNDMNAFQYVETDNIKIFNPQDFKSFNPRTENQRIFFDNFYDNNFILSGYAGTGKTFIALYLSLLEVCSADSIYDKVIIVRSSVANRDVGFLKGDLEEKTKVLEPVYHQICNEIIKDHYKSKCYENMKRSGYIEFMSSSFIRSITLNRCIIIVDEAQNMSYDELKCITTRVGEDCKLIICGDIAQTDLKRNPEVDIKNNVNYSGFKQFVEILEDTGYFITINFQIEDIVRSGLVKAVILAELRYMEKHGL